MIFDDLYALQKAVEAKEVRAGSGLPRLIATYDWEYNKKNGRRKSRDTGKLI